MDVTVKSKGCEVPPRLKEEAVGRIQHATRFFDRLRVVEMVFSEEANPRIPEPAVVEVTARAKGAHIRAQGCAEDHRGAVDVALARFERQLSRYKSRLVDRSRKRRATPPTVGPIQRPTKATAEEPWQPPEIVRVKRFEFPPMVPADAAAQLELLGHDFFVFTNAADGQCNVVYRRRDGQLGLIQPVD